MPSIQICEIPKNTTRALNSEIPHGSVFTGQISGYPDVLFFKSEGCIFSLDHDNCWDSPGCAVENYRPVKNLIAQV